MPVFYGKIENVERICEGARIYSLTAKLPQCAGQARPGHILQISCGDDTTLRRPISICDTAGDTVRICFDVRGKGTEWLSARKAGDMIDAMGLYGNTFDIEDTSKRALVVGGGIGIYPLHFLAKRYGGNVTAVLGFRNKSLVTMENEFRASCGRLEITTDDGSYGTKGYAIDTVRRILDEGNIDIIYTCGPTVMMRGIVEEAIERGIRCQVSLEERMGCGVGACLACACSVGGKIKRVCMDGPVFEGKDVNFNG